MPGLDRLLERYCRLGEIALEALASRGVAHAPDRVVGLPQERVSVLDVDQEIARPLHHRRLRGRRPAVALTALAVRLERARREELGGDAPVQVVYTGASALPSPRRAK